ncbi:hypothetical protein K2173_004273 [Erythroxylum novogranatense]|uniref:Acyl-[acyl-carrier-protein] hydrolase n=1 Tax=Erythroxylum novogranatense TaxID=1862640 RepID=A0AAV8U2P3_9ROSI|nr:hypothetical protein K2173_004273 [Erythroxylum novogranatense]
MVTSSLSSALSMAMIFSKTSHTTSKPAPGSNCSNDNRRVPSFRSAHGFLVYSKHGQPFLTNASSCLPIPIRWISGQIQTMCTISFDAISTDKLEDIPHSFVQDKRAYSQKLRIRSFEIDRDHKLSLEALMGYLQDTALNHARTMGIVEDGFGSTIEMVKNDLIWVISTMHILVDRYPTWADDVQLHTWIYAEGKNGMGRDWLIRDDRTGDILVRATSVFLIINKKTRKLSKFRDEIREACAPFFSSRDPIIEKDSIKIPQFNDDTEVHIRSGLRPGWNDLDINEHVNNIKYIDWILEGTPGSFMEHNEVSAMTLEYRKECDRDSVLESLSRVSRNATACDGVVELEHLLRHENGSEVMKARTTWKPKDVNSHKTRFWIPGKQQTY